MWFFRRIRLRSMPLYRVDNAIGAGTIVRGDLRSSGGFHIDGHVEGGIHSDGPVIIGEKGCVEGMIVASDVVVLGRTRGDIHASGHLEIGPAGRVVGDITIASFRMHKGGVFRGTSRMPAPGELPEASPVSLLQAPAHEHEHSGRTLPPPGDGAVPPPAGVRDRPPISGAIAIPPSRSAPPKLSAARINPRRTMPLIDDAEVIDHAVG